ncbi:hydroxyethylthiazole kinase [Microbacterium terrae]|uniref:Hydroxyethylthiazole kinase n=1 Tax=Microbacterium terrae TaxID=69369 RepID=A0A0M2H2U8_9MICO|nr:hydroxyethylthiazole kinase [Microbacterium terrae]KJL37764.1 Hydroxyethylthiazole kinase [Microbacterium terrae]MBP1076596.1 hydroxyethylthiazole kinase [Microbacterium terrae]GLJ97424.1 hydroxyethylthiazole kinase [Microbacterium terrae]
MSIGTSENPLSTSGSARAAGPATPGEALDALRAANPLVQCITNAVVTNFTANVLLALGASPAMCDIPGEAGMFAGVAGGVLVNLGTPRSEQRDAAREAVRAGTPWVLDPVAVGALPVRTALAEELLHHRPAIVRGNASEILAVAGLSRGGRGVDATDSPDDAIDAARALALRTGGVVVVTGEVDLVTDGALVARVHGGDVLLTRVTGGGCSLGATIAAFLAVTDPFTAAVTGCAVHSAAAERAASVSRSPGSFAVAFIDALDAVEPADLEGRVVEYPVDRGTDEAGESADDHADLEAAIR